MPATTPKNQRKGRRAPRARIPGICEDAATLGVNRSHLYRVLTGRRQSRSLLERYAALQAAKQSDRP